MKLNARPSDLLKILKNNRTNHESIFRTAMAKYKEALADLSAFKEKISAEVEEMSEKYKGIANGLTFYFQLPKPEKHIKDYDRIIRILELEQNDTIELSEAEVAMYVQNEWAWSQAFNTSTANYLAVKPDPED